jgi:hypothetical protein
MRIKRLSIRSSYARSHEREAKPISLGECHGAYTQQGKV